MDISREVMQFCCIGFLEYVQRTAQTAEVRNEYAIIRMVDTSRGFSAILPDEITGLSGPTRSSRRSG